MDNVYSPRLLPEAFTFKYTEVSGLGDHHKTLPSLVIIVNLSLSPSTTALNPVSVLFVCPVVPLGIDKLCSLVSDILKPVPIKFTYLLEAPFGSL